MTDLDATVFVYKHKETGNIEAEFLKEALVFEDNADYEHVATKNIFLVVFAMSLMSAFMYVFLDIAWWAEPTTTARDFLILIFHIFAILIGGAGFLAVKLEKDN